LRCEINWLFGGTIQLGAVAGQQFWQFFAVD